MSYITIEFKDDITNAEKLDTISKRSVWKKSTSTRIWKMFSSNLSTMVLE